MTTLASRWRRAWLVGLLAAAGCTTDPAPDGDGGAGDGGSRDGRTDIKPAGDGPITAPRCGWVTGSVAELPSEGTVQGALGGDSRNRSTTCTRQQGTGGPDTVYLLRVRQRSIVSLTVTSEFDSVLAVRKVCDDPLTEAACSDHAAPTAPSAPQQDPGKIPPGGFPIDAGVPAPGGNTNPLDAALRTTLEPGDYFVVVDEAAAFGVGGKFELTIATTLPPPNLTCEAATPLGSTRVEEELDVATTPNAACAGLPLRPALYHTLTVGPGEQASVRALPLAGSKSWQPQLTLLDGCTDSLCLATDQPSPTGERIVRHFNGGATPKTLVLVVSSDVAVNGAIVRLDTRIAPPVTNVTCEAALPVSDGTALPREDLTEAPPQDRVIQCGLFGRTLFYSIDLLEGQSATFTARGSSSISPMMLTMSRSCGSFDCILVGNGQASYRNNGSGTQRIIVGVATGDPNARSFSLDVSAPLPPGSVFVGPRIGHVVAESGTTSTFSVRLGSPPLQPVTLRVERSDDKEIAVAPTSVTFSPTDWNTPRTVTITGIDDATPDGDRAVTVRVLAATSADTRYDGIGAATIAVTNQDDEPGVRSVPTVITTSESGGTTTVNLRLIRKPTGTVRLPVSANVPSEAKVSVGEIVFTTTDWADPHPLVVTGVDDDARDGAKAFTVVLGALISDDPQYTGMDPADLAGTNADDEFSAVAQTTISMPGTSCRTTNTTAQRTLAIDDAGTLYVVMSCMGGGGLVDGGAGGAAPRPFDAGVLPPDGPDGVWIARSRDGGATFDLVKIDGVADAYDFAIAGGEGGVAYAAFSTNQGLYLTRSNDAGTTWQTSLVAKDDFISSMRLVSDGPTGWLAASTMGTGKLWRSDGTTDTLSERAVPIQFGGPWDLLYDRRTGLLALIGGNNALTISRSSDRGDSFESMGMQLSQSLFGAPWTQSPGLLHAIGFDQQHTIVPIDAPGSSSFVPVTGLDKGFRTYVADESGLMSVMQQTPSGGVELLRIAADGTFISKRPLAPTGASVATALALSQRAVAYTFWREGQIRFGIETFP